MCEGWQGGGAGTRRQRAYLSNGPWWICYMEILSCSVVEFGHCHFRGISCHLCSIEFSHKFGLACKYWVLAAEVWRSAVSSTSDKKLWALVQGWARLTKVLLMAAVTVWQRTDRQLRIDTASMPEISNEVIVCTDYCSFHNNYWMNCYEIWCTYSHTLQDELQ